MPNVSDQSDANWFESYPRDETAMIPIYLLCTLLHWVILVLSEGQHSAVEFICYAWLSDQSDAH